MGKKKDRAMPGPGKRRTVLQIEGPSVSSKKGYGQSSANALSGLMANYGDSDEEQEYTPPSYRDSKPAEAPAKPKTAMDAKLADFLAEIDAMDTASNSPTGETEDGKPVEDASIDGKPIVSDELNASAVQGVAEAEAGAEIANPELSAVGEWQELLDENTNCVYYWNMYTNEVTWEMPEAFKLQQEQLAAAATMMPLAPETNAGDAQQVNLQTTNPAEAMDVQNGDVAGAEIPNGVASEDLVAKMADAVGEVAKDEIEKLPVYGSERVKYQLDPVPDELADIVKDDLQSQDDADEVRDREDEDVPAARKPKLNYVSQFTKGETLLPASVDSEKSKAADERTENVGKDEMEEEEEDDDESDDGRYDLHPEPQEEVKETEKKKEKDELFDMFADEMDDIDTQLEMALEKKKAELKELEEAEVKKSPEPPKSEKGKKRKSDVADMSSIYDESGSVDLSRFKKKRLENLAGKQKSSGTTQETGIQCDLQEELTPEEKDKVKEKLKNKEEKEKKEEIVEMVSTMMNKLEFLGISTKGLNKFQVMLIEMETRIQDWREGIIDSKHLLQRLETSDWELQRYEMEAAPNGWLCSWDRTHKQYYYTNMATNESQWDYPVEAAAEDAKGAESTATREETRSAFSNAADRGSANSGESMDEGDTSDEEPSAPKPSEIQLPPALPPSEAPPQPPMPQEDADSPLPPPPLPDGPPPPPPPGEEPALPPLPPSPPPSSPPPAPPPEEADTIRPLTPPPFLATFPGAATLSQPPPPPQSSSRDSSAAVIGKPQVLYSAPAVAKGATTIAAAPVLSAPPTGVAAPPLPQQPAAPPVKSKKKKKKEKEPKLVKSKLPHSLVSKWSKIKEEQEKEMEESEESEEEDIGLRNQKMIEDWKKEQLVMGKAKYNANFEQIQGDWRERLKRKSNAKP